MAGMGATRARLARRFRYLWHDSDPDGVELLSATLSLSFAILLLSLDRHQASILRYNHAYAALCLVASLSKYAGVLLEWAWLRLLGLAVGTIFWTTLAYVLHRTTPASIAWLCYATLALAQVWAAIRVARQHRAPARPR